jgi:outer membrane protein TolC
VPTRRHLVAAGFVLGPLVWLAAPARIAAQDAPQARTPLLTLGAAVAEALLHNERALGQHDNVEQAGLGVRLAKNAFQPKVVPNILGSFGQTDLSNQTYRLDVTQKFSTGTALSVGAGTSTAQIPASSTDPTQGTVHFYDTDTTLTLTQPLLRGFGPSVGRRPLTSAELRQADALRQQKITEQQLTVEVAGAYYRLVAQQALVTVASQSLDRSRKLRDASEAKLDAGQVSQLDTLRAQQLVAQAEIQLFDAQGAVEDARDRLCLLIGRDADQPFTVVAEIPKIVEPLDVDGAVATALEKRLDLQAAVAAAADAINAISFARNQLLPQVDVNFALTRRETAKTFTGSFGLNRFQFMTFFTIAMPVDRTPQMVAYQSALIDRDRGRRAVDMLRKQIADDVRRGLRDRDRSIRILGAAEVSVDIGRKEVDIAELRYERGLSNNLDVVTAQANLLAAEARQILARAELAVARLSLRATLGILDPLKDVAESGGGVRD